MQYEFRTILIIIVTRNFQLQRKQIFLILNLSYSASLLALQNLNIEINIDFELFTARQYYEKRSKVRVK